MKNLKKIFENRKKIKLSILIGAILIIAASLVITKAQGGSFQFIQTDWSGGADTINKADHSSNQTGWQKFFSKNTKIDIANGEAKLNTSSSSYTHTSDADFNAGTRSNVYISDNSIKLLKPNGASCTSGSECQVGVCASNLCSPSCTLPWGGTINSGQSVTAYSTSSVPCGNTCAGSSQTRTCTDGVLSGSYTNQNCSVQACASCNLPWGGTIAHGQSVTAYASSTAQCEPCSSQTRTCNNGSLSGTYSYSSCTTSCSTCFVSNTKVTMSDGTLKNIEDVLIGEKVIGQNGNINTVLAYERPIIGSRSTYIINGKVEFTGDHPFLSTEGWKVADLELFHSMERNIGSEPTQLKIGDILITDQGPVQVYSLEENRSRPSGETVYDITLDGDNTYTANGFIVHNC